MGLDWWSKGRKSAYSSCEKLEVKKKVKNLLSRLDQKFWSKARPIYITTKVPSDMELFRDPQDLGKFFGPENGQFFVYKMFPSDVQRYMRSDLLHAWGSKMRIDIELLKGGLVRVEGSVSIGRYYYLIDSDGRLSNSGPGFLTSPIYAATYSRRLVKYSTYSKAEKVIDEIAARLCDALVERIIDPRSCP